jgi:hypothetical protein
MEKKIKSVREWTIFIAWKSYLDRPYAFAHTLLSIVFTLGIGVLMVDFLEVNEMRQSIELRDPFFVRFEPIDLSLPIFVMMYAIILHALMRFLLTPHRFLMGVQTYGIILFLRSITIYLTPLSAPPKMITLYDPFTSLFLGNQQVIVNDLFFSGHVSTAFLMYLIADKPFSKKVYALYTLLIATMLFLQQVHYTVDLVAAPFFTYGAYRLMGRFHKRFFKELRY